MTASHADTKIVNNLTQDSTDINDTTNAASNDETIPAFLSNPKTTGEKNVKALLDKPAIERPIVDLNAILKGKTKASDIF